MHIEYKLKRSKTFLIKAVQTIFQNIQNKIKYLKLSEY